jgi:arabinose-5-phosphate isomerase
MTEAILRMSEKGLGCVGITNATGRLVGIITDGDLRRHMDDDLLRSTVDGVMTKRPKTIRPQALAAEGLGRMHAQPRPIKNLFVVDEGDRPLGILDLYDCLREGVA